LESNAWFDIGKLVEKRPVEIVPVTIA